MLHINSGPLLVLAEYTYYISLNKIGSAPFSIFLLIDPFFNKVSTFNFPQHLFRFNINLQYCDRDYAAIDGNCDDTLLMREDGDDYCGKGGDLTLMRYTVEDSN